MTIVTVHSAITGNPVPGASIDTANTTFGEAIQLALSFPEVQRASMSDRLAAQDALEALFTGAYPYRGDIRDARLSRYGISHVTVEDAPVKLAGTFAQPAPEQDSAQDTPIYASLSAPSTAPAAFHSVKSAPSDFKPAKRGIDWQAVAVPVAAFIAGLITGGVLF